MSDTLKFFAHLLCSSSGRIEKLTLAFAVRTNEAAHILNNTDNWNISLYAKTYFLSDVS